MGTTENYWLITILSQFSVKDATDNYYCVNTEVTEGLFNVMKMTF